MGDLIFRTYEPSDARQLDALVAAHAATDPGYAPPAGMRGSEWLSLGIGPCLTRLVAELDGDVVGHVAVGGVPPCPQRDLWITFLKKNPTLVEIRRGMVHPEHVGTGIGGALTKRAFRWATERHYLPVAASLADRTNSVEMMRNYGWLPCGEVQVDGYGTVTLWVPPEKIVATI